MRRLTKDELEELSRLWDDLSRPSIGLGPPQTYDEMIEAGVDALLAGVFSSSHSPRGHAGTELRALVPSC